MSELERLSQLYWTAQQNGDKLKSLAVPASAAAELAEELAQTTVYGEGGVRVQACAAVWLASMQAGTVRLMALPVVIAEG